MEDQIPKIRFKGAYDENGKWIEFTHPWEQRKLVDYLEVSKNKNKNEAYGKEDVLSVSGEFGIVNQIEFQGRSFAGASVVNYGVVEVGDIVYTKSPLKSNPYGIIKTNKGKSGIVSTLYAVYKPKENCDSEFVQTYFELDSRMNSYMHPLVNKGAKNDMKVSDENALKGSVNFPKFEEQKAISQYFESLNTLITLHQRKCDLYQQAKQSMMEKLFSNNVDWEEKQLGEILIRNPKSNIGVHETQQMKSGDIPYFTSGEKIFYINDFLVKGENIFVNDGGVADIKYYNGKANYSDHILSLKNIDNSICLQFVYQSLLSKIKIINDKLFHGLGLKNLSKKDFMNFTISIPDIEEQIKIANVLSKYDELIAISKNQLDSIKTLKKGLLQQMFI